jgi:putative phage-type endonuclease
MFPANITDLRGHLSNSKFVGKMSDIRLTRDLVQEKCIALTEKCIMVCNVRQKSAAWHYARSNAITSTRISVLSGSNPYEKIERLENSIKHDDSTLQGPVNSAIIYGSVGESYVREQIARILRAEIHEICIAISRTHTGCRASPDGIIFDNDSHGKIKALVEIKCHSSASREFMGLASGSSLYSNFTASKYIQPYYADQIQYAMGIMGAPTCYFCQYYKPLKTISILEVKFDELRFAKLLNVASTYLHHIKIKEIPEQELITGIVDSILQNPDSIETSDETISEN